MVRAPALMALRHSSSSCSVFAGGGRGGPAGVGQPDQRTSSAISPARRSMLRVTRAQPPPPRGVLGVAGDRKRRAAGQ